MRQILLYIFLLFIGSVSAEQFKLTGKVVEAEHKEPLIGSTVQIKGTDRGTCADLDGNFSIEVEKGDTLKISCVGWYSKEVEVLNDSSLVIELEEDEKLSGFSNCPEPSLRDRIRRDPDRYRLVPIERDSTKTNPKKQNSMINH